jgi:hypothetical protein
VTQSYPDDQPDATDPDDRPAAIDPDDDPDDDPADEPARMTSDEALQAAFRLLSEGDRRDFLGAVLHDIPERLERALLVASLKALLRSDRRALLDAVLAREAGKSPPPAKKGPIAGRLRPRRLFLFRRRPGAGGVTPEITASDRAAVARIRRAWAALRPTCTYRLRLPGGGIAEATSKELIATAEAIIALHDVVVWLDECLDEERPLPGTSFDDCPDLDEKAVEALLGPPPAPAEGGKP